VPRRQNVKGSAEAISRRGRDSVGEDRNGRGRERVIGVGCALGAVRMERDSTGLSDRGVMESAPAEDVHSIHRGLCTLGAAGSAENRAAVREIDGRVVELYTSPPFIRGWTPLQGGKLRRLVLNG
jgi:hypothetical protein